MPLSWSLQLNGARVRCFRDAGFFSGKFRAGPATPSQNAVLRQELNTMRKEIAALREKLR
jgi:hypothetical protein